MIKAPELILKQMALLLPRNEKMQFVARYS